MTDLPPLLDSFPKDRPPLPDGIAAIYDDYYKKNRGGETPSSSLSQYMESWLHRRVSADSAARGPETHTLEIGAGNLNHIPHELNALGVYDIVEPFAGLYSGSGYLKYVRDVYADAGDIPLEVRYDRIISVATFEHICNLPEVVARCATLLVDDGQMRVSIPSEGTPLWKLGWMCTTGLEFKLRYGESYADFLAHEHVNTAIEIEAVLRWFFQDVQCQVFGLSRGLSLYQFYMCKNPDLERCALYLQQVS